MHGAGVVVAVLDVLELRAGKTTVLGGASGAAEAHRMSSRRAAAWDSGQFAPARRYRGRTLRDPSTLSQLARLGATACARRCRTLSFHDLSKPLSGSMSSSLSHLAGPAASCMPTRARSQSRCYTSREGLDRLRSDVCVCCQTAHSRRQGGFDWSCWASDEPSCLDFHFYGII